MHHRASIMISASAALPAAPAGADDERCKNVMQHHRYRWSSPPSSYLLSFPRSICSSHYRRDITRRRAASHRCRDVALKGSTAHNGAASNGAHITHADDVTRKRDTADDVLIFFGGIYFVRGITRALISGIFTRQPSRRYRNKWYFM